VQSPSSDKPILIVDDTPENVDVLAGILREHYQLLLATKARLKAQPGAAADDGPGR
jgi:CheY-like chemotaxis protein